ncbi:MAG TPA: hypothetical protein PKE56_06025 [Acidimicrobiales bacterium]|nr:hypothetical protein [Acidimicrobiales bacterium]
MTPPTSTPVPRASALARFGPLAAVLVAIALVAVLASTGRDDDSVSSGAGPSSTVPPTEASAMPISYAEAVEAGTVDDYDWGPECDPETGRVAVPSNYSPPCLVARPGAPGLNTGQGVTPDTVTIVAYEPADDDLSASLQANSDSPEVRAETVGKLYAMLEDRYEMWGRSLEIVRMKGSGSSETAARADAVKVAEEIGAFASVGGPGQQGAYAEELASRGVLCIGCGLSVPDSVFRENAPYMWGNLQTPEQYLVNLGDYLIERLMGRPAEFAGDPAMQTRTRVFGQVNFEEDPPVFKGVSEEADRRGKERGYSPAARLTYQLIIPELAEQARVIVGSLKEKGVTTVVFLGDPVMPIYLTKAATDQNYFPEWIITGTVLTDSTALGRNYDQTQWAHAFGISSLPLRLPPESSEARRLHRWYYGEEAVAIKTAQVVFEPIRLLMLGLHMAGPNLTPETFEAGMFAYPPSGGTPTGGQVSFGNRGIHTDTDYLAVDDMVEIWWDADAEGIDEQGNQGKGMMRFSDGGKRYLPGEMPKEDVHAFIEENAPAILDAVPPDEAPPSYPSPAGGG